LEFGLVSVRHLSHFMKPRYLLVAMLVLLIWFPASSFGLFAAAGFVLVVAVVAAVVYVRVMNKIQQDQAARGGNDHDAS